MPDQTPPLRADLAILALRYAAGDLPAEQMDAFERRLAEDQPARDALAEAIRLSASALGQAPPAPSPAVRLGVRDRLFPTWLTRLFPRRSYRGHPAAWAGLGGAVTAGVALAVVSLGGDPPVQYTGTPPAVRVIPAPIPLAPSDVQPDAVKRVEPDVLPEPMNPAVRPEVRAERLGEPIAPLPPAVPNDVPNVGMQHGCDPSNG